MKLQKTFFFALASIPQIAYSQGGPNNIDWDWDFAPSCAYSCLSSAYPTTTSTHWAGPCATPTSLLNCISTACTQTITASAFSSLSTIQSSLCSVYSSCSSASSSCTWHYPGFPGLPYSPWDNHNGSRPSGWAGPGSNGFYTFTCTDGRSSGWSTATLTLTSTVSGSAGTSVQTTVVKETATLVAADESGTSASSSAASTATGSSDASKGNVGVWGLGAFIAAGLWVVVML